MSPRCGMKGEKNEADGKRAGKDQPDPGYYRQAQRRLPLVKMLMQSVDVCDTVTVWDDADSPIQVFCNREEIPVSEANTAYRAAQAFFEAAKIENPCIGIKIKRGFPWRLDWREEAPTPPRSL